MVFGVVWLFDFGFLGCASCWFGWWFGVFVGISCAVACVLFGCWLDLWLWFGVSSETGWF